MGRITEPPEERSELNRQFREYMETAAPAHTMLSGSPTLPTMLGCVLHESYLPSLSETFSNASHDGPYDVALDTGESLLALYRLVYPPNYPQIGECIRRCPSGTSYTQYI